MKKDIIRKVREEFDLTIADAERIVDFVLGSIIDETKNTGECGITGFGRFKTSLHAEKKGRNPRTGEALLIPSRKSVKFQPGKNFKDAIT